MLHVVEMLTRHSLHMSMQVLLNEGSSISVLLHQELGGLHLLAAAVLWAQLLDHGLTQLQVSQGQARGVGGGVINNLIPSLHETLAKGHTTCMQWLN